MLKRPPKPVSMTLNLAPMVDVMMCLIIFFLLASKMVAAERYPVDLPWAAAGKQVEQSDLGQRVTITVRKAKDSDESAEYVVVDWDGRQIVERVLLPSELETLLQNRAVRAARENQKLRCVIRADRMVMYKHVEYVLRGCGLAQIRDIVFSVNEGTEAEGRG
jgi:biopolymer transport protein ExbD